VHYTGTAPVPVQYFVMTAPMLSNRQKRLAFCGEFGEYRRGVAGGKGVSWVGGDGN
jgi:hypothetical protein